MDPVWSSGKELCLSILQKNSSQTWNKPLKNKLTFGLRYFADLVDFAKFKYYNSLFLFLANTCYHASEVKYYVYHR